MTIEQSALSKESIKDLVVETVISLADEEEVELHDIDSSVSIEELSDFGFDSLSVFQLLCEIEYKLEINIEKERAESMRTLDDLVSLTYELAVA